MNESTEETSYIQKVLALARSSGKIVERLWRAKIDFSRFGDFISPIFSSIYSTIAKATTQVAGYNETVRKLYVNRLMFVPPFNLMAPKAAHTAEESAQIEMGQANVAFLFNVNVARKTAKKLTKSLAPRTPKPALAPTPLLGEVAEEGTQKAVETVPEIVAAVQDGLNQKIAPSIKGMTSVFRRVGSQKFLAPSFRATPKPLMRAVSQVESVPSVPSVATPEKGAPQLQLPESPSVTSYPYEMDTEIVALVSIPVVHFGAEAAKSVGYAAGLPSMLMTQGTAIQAEPSAAPTAVSTEAPVSMSAIQFGAEAAKSVGYAAALPSLLMQRGTPILAKPSVTSTAEPAGSSSPQVMGPYESAAKLQSSVLDKSVPMFSSVVLSTVAAPETATATSEATASYAGSATVASTSLSPLSASLKEVAPQLATLAHSVSKVVRATAHSLSAFPTVASTAAKTVMRTLLQSVPSVEAPTVMARAGWTLSRPKIEGKPSEVEAFRVPQIVTSLLVGLNQKYPLLTGEAELGKTLTSTVDLTGAVPQETLLMDTVPEVKTFSKLSTAIALASSESLIAQRLQQEPGILSDGLHIARSLPAETFGVGAFSPARASRISSSMATASSSLAHHGKPAPWGPSGPPRTSKLSPAKQTVHNTFNIAVPESTDADLRDLERKINRILSEQMRRYYGSTKNLR